MRAVAAEDPRGFLDAYPPPVIFDEVQYAPGILPYVKEVIDSHRDLAGQYLLTGSQNLLFAEKVTESLAGRAAVLRLLPLSRREAEGSPQDKLFWEKTRRSPKEDKFSNRDMWRCFLQGSYPELVANPGRDRNLWHAIYVGTYLERATYQFIILRPYFTNVGKRLVKMPKVYFTDTGTLCYLTGLKDPEHAASGPMGGAIMETAVVSEVVKTLTHQGIDPQPGDGSVDKKVSGGPFGESDARLRGTPGRRPAAPWQGSNGTSLRRTLIC